MIRVRVEDLRPGMKIAYPVFREDGSILLNKGVVLTENYIRRLFELGFESVFIEHELFEDIKVEEPVTLETKRKVQRILHESVKKLQRGELNSYQKIQSVIQELIEEVLDYPGVIFYLVQLGSKSDALFVHSVNVTVISLMIGKFQNLSHLQLKKLALGTLLHDVGKIRFPPEIFYKEGPLSEEERKIIRMHPVWSREIIQKHAEYDFLASVIALQHHERMNGSGYPYGLAGEEIHLLSRICACADVYDALTVDRPYRKRFSYSEALEYLMGNAGRLFDLQVVTTMVRHIAPYPVGETVKLSTGEIAVVIKLNEGLPIRPVVRVIKDREGRELETPKDLDLMSELTVSIVDRPEEPPPPSSNMEEEIYLQEDFFD
ncbi:HD-GYP domain-containing protein [Thermatribacter velox]|jgi:HD-GYP domain-containing protein (c-di-GMP phosphodiesterase class II)|uniref:HD-GYP domain-containing protein n=1 Tax=Thermatribacter velox TaxID=3039681 RepID=A0ABZ2YDV1_9BACT